MTRIDYRSGLLALGLMVPVTAGLRLAFGASVGLDVGAAALAAASGAAALGLTYLLERAIGNGTPPGRGR